MELQEFIKSSLEQIVGVVNEVNRDLGNSIYFTDKGDQRTIEFDIAVSAESGDTKSGGLAIKVLEIVDVGGKKDKSEKNSKVSRIKFGVNIKRYGSTI